MASVTSTGIGSGLDINSLVTQLVAAERAPADKRLTNTDAKLTAQLTAVSAPKGALAGLQGAVNGLEGQHRLRPAQGHGGRRSLLLRHGHQHRGGRALR